MTARTKKLLSLAVIAVVDILFFGFVNPTKSYALVVVIGFVLLTLSFWLVLDALLRLLRRVMRLPEPALRRSRNFATGIIAVLIAMQSIGQLTVRDIAAIVPLVAVLLFWLSYQKRQGKRT